MMKPIQLSASRILVRLVCVFLIAFLHSCGPKPWPENYLNIAETPIFHITMYASLPEEVGLKYHDCVVSTYKSTYPDFSVFERTLIKNPLAIQLLHIPCSKSLLGENLDAVWGFVIRSSYTSQRKNVPNKYYDIYKDAYLELVKNKFLTMNSFLELATVDESKFALTLNEIDNQASQMALNEHERKHDSTVFKKYRSHFTRATNGTLYEDYFQVTITRTRITYSKNRNEKYWEIKDMGKVYRDDLGGDFRKLHIISQNATVYVSYDKIATYNGTSYYMMLLDGEIMYLL